MKKNKDPVITVDLANPDLSKEELEKAFQTGTFILKNAPINFERLLSVQSELDKFYNLDNETKLAISDCTSGQGATRGYFPIGAESGLAEVFEKKESYSFGWPDKEIAESEARDLSLVARNIYPEDNCITQDDVDGLIKDFANTAKKICQLIEVILFNGESCLPIDVSSDHQSLLRS
jgi:isopenicillin N synthase-like dioxygenase